jgi:hypothetical protein
MLKIDFSHERLHRAIVLIRQLVGTISDGTPTNIQENAKSLSDEITYLMQLWFEFNITRDREDLGFDTFYGFDAKAKIISGESLSKKEREFQNHLISVWEMAWGLQKKPNLKHREEYQPRLYDIATELENKYLIEKKGTNSKITKGEWSSPPATLKCLAKALGFDYTPPFKNMIKKRGIGLQQYGRQQWSINLDGLTPKERENVKKAISH